jgi:hypothetical protein
MGNELTERLEPLVLVPVHLLASAGVGGCFCSTAAHDGDFFANLHDSSDAHP